MRFISAEHIRARWLTLVFLITVGGYAVSFWWSPPIMLDLHVYAEAVRALATSDRLYLDSYAGMRFVYPPFAAILMTTMTAVPPAALPALMTALSVAALGAALWCALRLVRRTRPALVLGLCGLALWLEPVRTNLDFGQVNIFVMFLVLLDFSLRADNRLKGVALGLAVAVKLTPAIFVVYLLLTKRYRVAAVAGLTVLGTISLSFLVLPVQSARFWGGAGFDASRMGGYLDFYGNQSLGQLIGGTSLVTAVVGVAGLLAARRVWQRFGELPGVLMCALTGLLVSPVSWHHHWVWVAPALVLLLDASVPLVAAFVALFACLPGPSDLPHLRLGLLHWSYAGADSPWPLGALQFLTHNLYVLAGLAVLVWTLIHTRGGTNIPGTFVAAERSSIHSVRS
ncbi:glycosyltransferase 87 family protein [Allokutzneria sp. A3M-2-11 16]|uniref:glycosyltransferase 87 family protein n=1 Tax=Allokutzneria sp. A3M-2-11 16 TaxID=2962043 RepID=UPI0020B77C6C|nr:glycosyltransferase 87 family protein [Allokutzneria sp. A3M-2-11 16]MCP3802308.1 glycosyltransferase 87 family protein [Allokutzneria sp. A3M-2-11 16]